MRPLARLRAARLAVRAAHAARAKHWIEAADLYERALRLRPAWARVLVQAGHMRKEAGDLAAAERHYDDAVRLIPDDADLALQRGHFYRLAGRHAEAAAAYRRAVALRPGVADAEREVERLSTATLRRGDVSPATIVDGEGLLAPARVTTVEGMAGRLLPEYLPSPTGCAPPPAEGASVRRLGRIERSPWGPARTLRGIEAILGHCVSRRRLVRAEMPLNGVVVGTAPLTAVPVAGGGGRIKHSFNLWLDFADFIPGRYHAEILFREEAGAAPDDGTAFRDHVVVAAPLDGPGVAGGEAWVPPIDPADPRPLDEQIDARPSLVLPPAGAVLARPRRILVLRTDQLGDLAISVPALLRLRALAPDAAITGVVTTANADLARTLNLFDELLVADFPDIAAEGRRVMAEAEQHRLRDLLRARRFDLAIDLAPSGVSRNLLLLAGATMTAGFGPGAAPWLGASFDLFVRDAVGHAGILPSADKTVALIEAVGTLFAERAAPIPARPDPVSLARSGLVPPERFVVLHDGARVAFSRWPYYPELAARLLARGDLKVVLLTDRTDLRGTLPEALLGDPRFLLLDERLAFAELDALLAACTLFVGNDSGPKHLAALRGTAVVSVHSARTNWGEWGQGGRGAIVTRRLPCAACHIYNEPEECARDFACVTRITVDEVLAAAGPFLAESA